MDVVVIVVHNAWGMLLSRKWAATLGASLQIDLSYATIPTPNGTFFTLYRQLVVKYQVEDPQDHVNEVVNIGEEFNNFFFLTNMRVSIEEDIEKVSDTS